MSRNQSPIRFLLKYGLHSAQKLGLVPCDAERTTGVSGLPNPLRYCSQQSAIPGCA